MLRGFKREQLLPPKEGKNSNFQNISGVGLSVRPRHYADLLNLQQNKISWIEILADNYLDGVSPGYEKIERLSALYPSVFHCVGFNLGSTEALDQSYLKRIKVLVQKLNPSWISDHLCFCGNEKAHSPDLLPIPYNKKLLQHISNKIKEITEFLKNSLFSGKCLSLFKAQGIGVH